MKMSTLQERGRVQFPAFTAERVYMREFTRRDGLPADLSRWQSTVDAMLDGVDADGPIYLMVDQKVVEAGTPHRRPGIHVDGYWVPRLNAHGQPDDRGSGHNVRERRRDGSHVVASGRHGGHKHGGSRELLLLASDVAASRALVGEWSGDPADDGDCSHISLTGLESRELAAARVWQADALQTLHESFPVDRKCARTFVRLNVPQ